MLYGSSLDVFFVVQHLCEILAPVDFCTKLLVQWLANYCKILLQKRSLLVSAFLRHIYLQ